MVGVFNAATTFNKSPVCAVICLQVISKIISELAYYSYFVYDKSRVSNLFIVNEFLLRLILLLY